ncbi:MAG TPA: FecR domain-containing protein [Pseudobdellovibrionaceae bacterium]|nr:FecR domain-containing protein [Pseudobdellovibrionaceae bacterium]
MQQSDKTERIILILAALLIAVFSYFLYDDSLLFPRIDDSGLEKIGKVSVSSRDVRLKTATAFTWFPADRSDDVRLMDSVFTGERSSAQITLNDGTDLVLKENSLVTLTSAGGEINLDLRFGDITSKIGSKGLKITSGGETYTIDGSGTVSLKKSSSGELEVAVTGGRASIRTKNGSHTLEDGKTLGITKKGAADSIEIGKIETVTPPGVQYYKIKKTDPLTTQWKPYPKVKTYQWDLCETPSCEKVTRTIKSSNSLASTSEPFPEGRYYWRVSGLDSKGRRIASSETLSLDLSIAKAPKITTSPESSFIRKEVKVPTLSTPPAAPAEVSWQPEPEFSHYEYEIAATTQFEPILHKDRNKTGIVSTPPLKNGVYYYHVRGVFENGRSTDWSDPQQLTVSLTAVLGDPPNKIELEKSAYGLDAETLGKRSPSSVPPAKVRWTTDAKSVGYKVQLSRDASFKDVKTVEVNGNSLDWSKYAPGVWHVRVQGVSQDKMEGPLSEPAKLNILSGRPILEPFSVFEKLAKDADTPAPAIEAKAQWSSVPVAKSYRLQISKDSSFKSPRQLISRKPASSVKIDEPGTYFIRVQGIDEDGEPVTRFSETQTLRYNYHDPMAPPRLAEPYDRASIFLQTTKNPMFWLEWTRVKEATSYQVEIAGDAGFEKVLFRTEAKDPRVLLQNKVPTGKFFWRVRSRINEENRSSMWSEVRTFEIDSQGLGGFNL